MPSRGDLSEQGIRPYAGGILFSEGQAETTCPECSHLRKLRNQNKPCLSVIVEWDHAKWNCHHCGWSGATRWDEAKDRAIPRETTPPPKEQPRVTEFKQPEIQPLSEPALEWFKDRRGISAGTLTKADVGLVEWSVGDKRRNMICFPYYDDGELVAAKLRTPEKDFAQPKGGKQIFWGLDLVDPNPTFLIITEGEIDALTAMEAGFVNVLSAPNGANQRLREGPLPEPGKDTSFKYLWHSHELLEAAEQIILLTDNDEPGRVLEEELARRLGKDKCLRATYPEGCKDLNDVLVKHGRSAVIDVIEEAKPFPIEDLYTPDDIRADIIGYYRDGRKPGLPFGYPDFDRLFSFRPGELTIVTGKPGAGKSEFVDQLVVQLAKEHNIRTTYCSLENPLDEHAAKIIEKRVGEPFGDVGGQKMSERDVEDAVDWMQEYITFIRPDVGNVPDLGWLLETAQQSVLRYGIRLLVIDPYNRLQRQNEGASETEHVLQVLTKLAAFAQRAGCHVIIVAHPAKIGRTRDGTEIRVPSLYDISGSAHWFNICDNGIVVVRDHSSPGIEAHVKKIRFRSTGKVGIGNFDYDEMCGVFSERSDDDDDDWETEARNRYAAQPQQRSTLDV
jgi:twinkle protein